ncbi:uncharacterized protein LOC131640124 [Vicia villosa]|uniref:uncharacterized protein LOC131640124 n=1 Tax=Vicia villosa TaxID=3911 RepID=UPI00273BB4D0|nr:uncharacterized protein LOC131640124 [Vicia villosa]
MVHPDNISSKLASLVDVSASIDEVVANVVDVGGDFISKHDFDGRESMLTWIRRKAVDLGFGVVIGRSDNGTARRNPFVTMLCERSGKYNPPLKKFKKDDTGQPMASRLNPVEKASIKDMSLNFVQPKNILATLKRKEPDNISNIRQVYNQRYRNNKAIRGDGNEMQQLLKMLDDNKYLSRKVKVAVGTKQVATEGGKAVKPGVIVDQIMDAWARIANSSTKELYVDTVLQFWKICEKYPDLLKYVESTILDKVKEKKGDLCKAWDTIHHMISNQHNEIKTSFGQSITVLEHRFKDNILYSQLIGNMSRFGLNYIFHEAKQGETFDGDTAKCGCTITSTYGLPCACVLSKKVRLGEPIRMNEVIPHWKRLSFDDDGCIEEDSNISIIFELKAIQERFSKADDNMKLIIKEQLRRIGFPETIDMIPPSQPVKTKGAPKKVKSMPNDNSITRSPSYFEHVDKRFPDSPTSKSQKSQKSSNKGARISKPPPTPIPPQVPQVSTPIPTPIAPSIQEVQIAPKIPFIDEMPVFMHKYIDQIVNVVRDGNCGFRAVSALLGKGEDAHELIGHDLIK